MSLELPVSLNPPLDPSSPPARIYIGEHLYKIAAPRFIHLPLVNTVKVVLNWVGAGARLAKNVFYALVASGTNTADLVNLKLIANQIMTSWVSSNLQASTSAIWTLNSVTARDNGSNSGSQNVSDHAPVPGTAVGNCLPPQCAVAVSWKVTQTWRGGKARWYLPGVPESAQVAFGDSALTTAYAGSLATAARQWLTSFNGTLLLGTPLTAGIISYQTKHAARPTPIFMPYVTAEVHERLDSQRRRSGKESAFGELP